MAACREWTFRFPQSLIEDVQDAAASESMAASSFVVQAVAEKVAFLRGRNLLHYPTPGEQQAYLTERASRARPGDMTDILAKAGTTNEVLPGDELPEGWHDAPAPTSTERAPAEDVPAA